MPAQHEEPWSAFIGGAHVNHDQLDQIVPALAVHWTEQAENPNWAEHDASFKNVHDWRTYIPIPIRAIWHTLDLKTRLLLIYAGDEMSSNENWE